MHASAAGAQLPAALAWATVPIFAVTLMKSDPSLLIKAYRKHEQLSSEAQPNVGKLFRGLPDGAPIGWLGVCRQTDRRRAKVRYGSLADIVTSMCHVRFTPNNGLWMGASESEFGRRFMYTS
jgi:hypothetical protein